MPQHSIAIKVNDHLTIDAGSWQERVEGDLIPYRLVSPPQATMYRQVLSSLEEATRGQKAPPSPGCTSVKWRSRPSRCVCAGGRTSPCWPRATCRSGPPRTNRRSAASATGRWRASTSRPQRPWPAGSISCGPTSSTSASWSGLPIQCLPFPTAPLDGATYHNRFRAFSAINSANGRRYLMEAFARDFGSEWLEREKARILVNPTRALANGILNEHWRNGSGIEDVHAGGVARTRPLAQRPFTQSFRKRC